MKRRQGRALHNQRVCAGFYGRAAGILFSVRLFASRLPIKGGILRQQAELLLRGCFLGLFPRGLEGGFFFHSLSERCGVLVEQVPAAACSPEGFQIRPGDAKLTSKLGCTQFTVPDGPAQGFLVAAEKFCRLCESKRGLA